jgi:hypothetical protein
MYFIPIIFFAHFNLVAPVFVCSIPTILFIFRIHLQPIARRVNMLLVDRLLSKNFRRHDTSSTSILSKFFRRHDISSIRHFVDATFRRHHTSSKFFCRRRHAEVEELLRILSFFKFQTIQLLNVGSEGEGDNYKTTSDKVRVKAKIFKLDHTK